MKDKCRHPGCHHHVTHPCEDCGKIAGRDLIKDDEAIKGDRKIVCNGPTSFYQKDKP